MKRYREMADVGYICLRFGVRGFVFNVPIYNRSRPWSPPKLCDQPITPLEAVIQLHNLSPNMVLRKRLTVDEILKFKQGELDGVFHVHGSYHDPREVVLDSTDYYKVTQSSEVQNILKTFLEYKTMLFVGCGSGLEDPNFDVLLKWASERQKNFHRP
jgi:hypothetical protein